MPRSSRHKSSKHSSREAEDYYSDSEEDYTLKLKDKRSKENVNGGSNRSSRNLNPKDSTSGQLDSKLVDVAKEPDIDTSLSFKKWRGKLDDDRWNGGENNEHWLSKSEVKSSSDSKRGSRRDENSISEEGKRNGSKIELKNHRKERAEKEGNRKQGGSSRGKHADCNADVSTHDEFQSLEPEREVDRRVKGKTNCSGECGKHQDSIRELDDRLLSFGDDIARSETYKDVGQRVERTRDEYREDVDKPSGDCTNGWSDEKHLRMEKEDLDLSEKKSKTHGSKDNRYQDRERQRERDRDRDRDHKRDRDCNRDRDRDRDRGCDHGYDRDHDDRDIDNNFERGQDRELELHHDRERKLDRDREHRHDRERKLDRDWEHRHDRERKLDLYRERRYDRYHCGLDDDRVHDRDHSRYRGRERDYEHHHDRDDGSRVHDKGDRHKEDKHRRRSPDAYDDYPGYKPRRVGNEADREGAHDPITDSSRHEISPSTRDGQQDDVMYGASLRDTPAFSESADKVSECRSVGKRSKFDGNHIGKLSESSPSLEASPAGLKGRSPSSTSVGHRCRTERRILDVDNAERICSVNDMNEDKQGRVISAKRSLGEDYCRAESSFYPGSNQGNISVYGHGPGSYGFRTGVESPSLIGSMDEDSRGQSGDRFRRNVDHNVGRKVGNAWNGVPNWPLPLHNGFMPFPPGPHHGVFPPGLSQFPPFGVRPSLEMNHSGIPYHMVYTDWFPGHLRPMGWQNIVDGPVPLHFLGWDANNGVHRDEFSMHGPGHPSGSCERDMHTDMWKSNGDMRVDVTYCSQKNVPDVKASIDEASSAQGSPRPHYESSCLHDQEMVSVMNASGSPPSEGIPVTSGKVAAEKTSESCDVDDTANSLHAYLATLDISLDLADRELYDEFIGIVVKGPADYVEGDVDYECIETSMSDSEITSLDVCFTVFPAAKDSIFQRAMDLYNAYGTDRRKLAESNRKTLQNPPTSLSKTDQSSVLDERVDSTVDFIAKQEEHSTMVDSANVCEAVMSMSNGSDLVILSPIHHHAPQSTH